MVKYSIWDKKRDLYPLSGGKMTPEDVFKEWGWSENPSSLVLISEEGGIFRSIDPLETAKSRYGIEADDADEAVRLINEIANAPAPEPSNKPTAEERIAAALEFNNLLNM